MSSANNPRPERDEDYFEEPDYDQFSDEELDALARGESLDEVKSRQGNSAKKPAKKSLRASHPVDDDLEPEEIDPALEAELQKEFEGEDFDTEPFDEDDDWGDSGDDELDNY